MAGQRRNMKLAVILAAFVALLLASCGDPEGDAKLTSRTPEQLAEDVLAAMADVGSYRSEFSIEGEDAVWTYEYAAPDSYRVLIAVVEESDSSECYVLPDGATAGPCEGNAESGERSVYESIYVDEHVYTRKCDDIEGGCGDWETNERPPVVIPGPSPSFLPGWPLVAIEMAQFESLGSENDAIVMRGSVNHLRAVFENQRRVLTAAGITTFGSECTSSPTPEGFEDPDAPVDQVCHELTFEESLEQQEPDLSFFDGTPAQIEVTIAPYTSFVRRIALHTEASPDHEEGVELVIEYSQFGEVQIEAPE